MEEKKNYEYENIIKQYTYHEKWMNMLSNHNK